MPGPIFSSSMSKTVYDTNYNDIVDEAESTTVADEMNKLYVSTKGSASGRGTESDPLDTYDRAITWIESVSGGNDPSHAQYWVIQLSSGTYGSSSSPINVPDRVIVSGVGRATELDDYVELDEKSQIQDLQISKSNANTTGIVKFTEKDGRVLRCEISTTSYSSTNVVGIRCEQSGCKIKNTTINLNANVSNVELRGLLTANQKVEVQDLLVIFGGSQVATTTRKVVESNGSGDVSISGLGTNYIEDGINSLLSELSTGRIRIGTMVAQLCKATDTTTADITINSSHFTVRLDGTSNTVVATLPSPADVTGHLYNIIAINIDNQCSIVGTLNGVSGYVFANARDSLMLQSNGIDYDILVGG